MPKKLESILIQEELNSPRLGARFVSGNSTAMAFELHTVFFTTSQWLGQFSVQTEYAVGFSVSQLDIDVDTFLAI